MSESEDELKEALVRLAKANYGWGDDDRRCASRVSDLETVWEEYMKVNPPDDQIDDEFLTSVFRCSDCDGYWWSTLSGRVILEAERSEWEDPKTEYSATLRREYAVGRIVIPIHSRTQLVALIRGLSNA